MLDIRFLTFEDMREKPLPRRGVEEAAVGGGLQGEENAYGFAGEDFMKSEETLENYIRTLQPCVYDDFIATAVSFMSDDNREQLRHLLTFKFKRHRRYNLPNHDLSLIERQIRKRAGLLLG